jgi:hypothetical protein
MGCRILDIVIPAQAGIHSRRHFKDGDWRLASFWTVGGYGSRALLRSPGMTVLCSDGDPGSAVPSGMTQVVNLSKSQRLQA